MVSILVIGALNLLGPKHTAGYAVFAAAGMVAQIVMGIVTANSEGARTQRNLALAHLIVGYTTVAATFTGFTVLTFN